MNKKNADKTKRAGIFALSIAFAVAAAAGPQEQKPEEKHKPISPDRIYTFPTLNVVVEDFPARVLSLDIGGRGEGVIGQLKHPRVVAIHLIRDSLLVREKRPVDFP